MKFSAAISTLALSVLFLSLMLCLAKIKNAFEINNIQRGHVMRYRGSTSPENSDDLIPADVATYS